MKIIHLQLIVLICIYFSIMSCTHLNTPSQEKPLDPGTDVLRTTPEELETNMETHGVSSEEIDDPDIQIEF